MSTLRNVNIEKFGNGTPTVGTFDQTITAFEVRDVAVKWEYELYETNYDMLPVEITGDGTQSFEDGMLVGSSATSGTIKMPSRKKTRYRTANGGFGWFTVVLNSGSGMCYSGLESDNGDSIIIKENNGTVTFGYSRLGVEIDTVTPENFSEVLNGNVSLTGFNWTDLNIFRITYGYLGSALPSLYAKIDGQTKLLHDFNIGNTVTQPYIRFPQFRMVSYTENGATVKSGSWGAGTYSNVLESRGEDPSARPFFHKTERTISPNATPQPIVAYRSKSTYGGFTHSVTAKLLLSKIATTSEGLYEFSFIFNPTSITGTFSDINTLSSVIEVSDDVSAYVGGQERFAIPVAVPSSGTGVAALGEDFDKLGVFLARDDSVVITIREIQSGGGSNNHILSFSWQELQ